MANLITIGRLVLLFIVIWMIYVGNVEVITACMILVIVVFASDGLDGWVARKRQSTSTFGAVFDIAGDRIVENALWVIFADLDLIPIWVPLLVMSRGFIVDGLRSLSYGEGMSAFGDRNMMRSAFTEWLTAGRFMRAFFGYAKAAGFVFLTGLVAERTMDTDGTALGALYGQDWYMWLGWGLVWAAVALTVIRGLPVMYDSLAFMRELDRRNAETRS
jgi:CDP-diacylglycerol---glycerol-3-phosphate 3-phosphatidyltransferase